MIACFFLVPTISLITRFVFDASAACEDVDNYTGKECLVVSARFASVGMAIDLVLYAVLAITLSRLCVSELHGFFGHTGATGASQQAAPQCAFEAHF